MWRLARSHRDEARPLISDPGGEPFLVRWISDSGDDLVPGSIAFRLFPHPFFDCPPDRGTASYGRPTAAEQVPGRSSQHAGTILGGADRGRCRADRSCSDPGEPDDDPRILCWAGSAAVASAIHCSAVGGSVVPDKPAAYQPCQRLCWAAAGAQHRQGWRAEVNLAYDHRPCRPGIGMAAR